MSDPADPTGLTVARVENVVRIAKSTELTVADKQHKRTVDAARHQWGLAFEDRKAERFHVRFLASLATIGVLTTFALALFVGKADLAEKIVTPVIAAAAYALGGLRRQRTPKSAGEPDSSNLSRFGEGSADVGERRPRAGRPHRS